MRPLEPSGEEMREIGESALRALIEMIEGLPGAPASDADDVDAVLVRLRRPPPEDGLPLDEVLGTIAEAGSKGVETAGPGFVGYIPGGGLYASAIAALLGFGMNRFVNLWDAAPAFAQIEATVLRWFADLFDYPPEAQGLLTSGGSLANLTAIVAARKAHLGDDLARGTLYTSERAHHSVVKSAMIAGFPVRNVRTVPTTPELRMDVSALHRIIDEDRASGLRPFLIVATAGTTDTGTVDPLEDLVGLAHERRLWLHVDAAYGGFFQLTARGRRILKGIGGADSITLDPHKGLFLPYGTGALIVREGRRLREAHEVEAGYLQDMSRSLQTPNFTDYSPELSRDFRGLRVWLPLMLHGLGAFRETLDEKLDLARFVYEELRGADGFEVPWEPDLTVVPFRYGFRRREPEDGNRELLRAINASRRVFLSSTTLHGRFTLRVCILSHRTHRDRMEELVEIVRKAAAELDA